MSSNSISMSICISMISIAGGRRSISRGYVASRTMYPCLRSADDLCIYVLCIYLCYLSIYLNYLSIYTVHTYMHAEGAGIYTYIPTVHTFCL